jgi:deoxyribodipyrimidine photo-lyase
VYSNLNIGAHRTLEAFLPHAGLDYARNRNYDCGAAHATHVSRLSPWVRQRVIPEWQLITDVLNSHTVEAASKFIDEVCWRTYWKGWLQCRPSVWDAYLEELALDQQNIDGSALYNSVVTAESGIDCMDTWTRELRTSGYLHNHARMWYASIWIHTLKLPWTLGADFFFKHLFDGDPASNTLSWRWVAGLHTAGKVYLATAENIKKYSHGRFNPQFQFATTPVDVSKSSGNPPAVALETLVPLANSERVGILLHEEDLSALEWLGDQATVIATAGFIPQQCYQTHGIAPHVFDFRLRCLTDCLDTHGVVVTQLAGVVEWAKQEGIEVLLMAEPSVGIWSQYLPTLEHALLDQGIQLDIRRHWWDEHFYPHAHAGFFRFKKAIPCALKKLI